MNRVVWTPQTYLTFFDVPVHRNIHCQYHRTHRTDYQIPPTESRALQGEWQPDLAAFPAHGAGRKCSWRFFRERGTAGLAKNPSRNENTVFFGSSSLRLKHDFPHIPSTV